MTGSWRAKTTVVVVFDTVVNQRIFNISNSCAYNCKMSGTSKRRNSEKRKEKSRDAARFRRSKETEIFTELSQQIPACSGSHGQLDKASVMRLAISHLKINKLMEGFKNNVFEKEKKLDYLYPKALEGFVAVLSPDGDIVYVSENVVKYLGIPQIDLIGQSLYEFAHPRDHDEVSDIFFGKNGSKSEDNDLRSTFFMRMKCTLTSKGRSVNLKSASYKVIKFSGRMMERDMSVEEGGGNRNLSSFLVLVGEPIPHPSNIEVPLDSKTFLTRHNMDMTFTYCDERIKDLVGYNSQELIDQSLYSYHHAADSEVVAKGYKNLFAKGQMMTEQYRLMAKNGGYVWVITQGTIIYNNRTQKPQCVVCVHFVLSEIEENGTIMSALQKVKVEHVLPTFKLSTEDVFQPKPKNMRENDFYFPPGMKINENDKTVDLTHLAPTAGDICIDLPFTVPVPKGQETNTADISRITVKKMKEEPGLTGKSMCSKMKAETGPTMTTYRPNFACTATPPSSLSPINSPEDYQSSLTPGDVEAMDKFFSSMDTNSFEQHDTNPLDLDMDMRAPYIPMNAEEDFNLMPPTSEALFSLNSDFNPAFFGRTESIFIPKGKILPDSPKEQRQSLRDMLGGSTAVASIEQPPDTFHLQTKRPFDVNSLEKGPPAKMAKKSVGQGKVMPNKTSVLLNLLVSGEDRATGYSVKNKLPSRQQICTSGKFYNTGSSPQIRVPPQQSNPPLQLENLLQESDLMQALENFLPSSALI